jgi:plasmid stability protein
VPNILIRNLSEETLAKLKARARRNHRSTQAEVVEILEQGVKGDPDDASFWSVVQRAREESRGKVWPDAADLVRADRER